MKKFVLFILTGLLVLQSQAQFTKASLQATGLTCAMCNNAINKALQKVSFVESVKSDIKNSAFNIVFKENDNINIDALKKAVEDAGFSVGSLKLTGNFAEATVSKDHPVKIGNDNFHFLNMDGQSLSGEKTVTVVDKNYMTAKDFKKYSAVLKEAASQTVTMQNGKIYYVVI